MRALTLTQPWCGLVAAGLKLVENRPRRMIKAEDFGKRFAIHASREIDERVYATIRRIAPDLAIDRPDADTFQWRDHRWVGFSRITNAVLAVATLDSIVAEHRCGMRVDDDGHCERCGLLLVEDDDVKCPPGFLAGVRDAAELPLEQRRWFFGPIGYVLRDVIPLPTAVPCRGWQGFWTLNGDTEQRVMEQLR